MKEEESRLSLKDRRQLFNPDPSHHESFNIMEHLEMRVKKAEYDENSAFEKQDKKRDNCKCNIF